MKRHKRRGLFIVLEGMDNCGKTTQARRLVAALRRRSFDVTAVREPGGTAVSERIRRILLSRRSEVNERTELLLYLAARAQVTAEKIIPALRAGKIVVADRYHLSTYAYQIGGRRLPAQVVQMADRFARQNIRPDLTFVLDIPPAEAQRRLAASGQKPDRMEKQHRAFFVRARRYYLKAAKTGQIVQLLDGRRRVPDLAAEILAGVLDLCRGT